RDSPQACAWRLTLRSVPDGLPEMSNCYCHPGKAGGLPVLFKGMVSQSDLPALYRRATRFIAPFLVADSGDQESFGLVLVEAMGCGCPVICGDVPAVRDIVLDESTGILVNPRNPVNLADAIVGLLADPIRRDRYSENARRHCAEAFDWGTIAAGYGMLLSEVLNKDPEKT
ncbi:MULTISPECIES: glycosyltransferase, partial [unclassified Thiocapsa]